MALIPYVNNPHNWQPTADNNGLKDFYPVQKGKGAEVTDIGNDFQLDSTSNDAILDRARAQLQLQTKDEGLGKVTQSAAKSQRGQRPISKGGAKTKGRSRSKSKSKSKSKPKSKSKSKSKSRPKTKAKPRSKSTTKARGKGKGTGKAKPKPKGKVKSKGRAAVKKKSAKKGGNRKK